MLKRSLHLDTLHHLTKNFRTQARVLMLGTSVTDLVWRPLLQVEFCQSNLALAVSQQKHFSELKNMFPYTIASRVTYRAVLLVDLATKPYKG